MSDKKQIVKLGSMQLLEMGESRGKSTTSGEESRVQFYIIGQDPTKSETKVHDLKYDRELSLPSHGNVYAFNPPKFFEASIDDEETKKKIEKKITEEPKKKAPIIKPSQKSTGTLKQIDKTSDLPQEFSKMTEKQMKKWITEAEKQENLIFALKRDIEVKFLAMGIALINFDQKQLWRAKDRECKSLREWLAKPEVNIPKTNAYRYMGIVNFWILNCHYKPEELTDVGEVKLDMLSRTISTESKEPVAKETTDDWLGKARLLSLTDLKKETTQAQGKPVYEVQRTVKGELALKESKLFIIDKKEETVTNLIDLVRSYNDCNFSAVIKIISKEPNK